MRLVTSSGSGARVEIPLWELICFQTSLTNGSYVPPKWVVDNFLLGGVGEYSHHDSLTWKTEISLTNEQYADLVQKLRVTDSLIVIEKLPGHGTQQSSRIKLESHTKKSLLIVGCSIIWRGNCFKHKRPEIPQQPRS
jgi:hypothetical protein